jgi:hypothetical protein
VSTRERYHATNSTSAEVHRQGAATFVGWTQTTRSLGGILRRRAMLVATALAGLALSGWYGDETHATPRPG